MHKKRYFPSIALGATGLAVVLILILLRWSPGTSQPAAPAVDAQAESFSLAPGSPLLITGLHPADVFGLGGGVLLPCSYLGLSCNDPTSNDQDDIGGLSYGQDFSGITNLPGLQFSVAAGTQGLPGSAVRAEAGCSFPEPQADVFQSGLDGANTQDLDGDGVACASNAGFSLFLSEGRASDDIDALEGDPCLLVDFNCDGSPDEPVYFSLKPGSPSLSLLGAAPADILMAGGDVFPTIYARASEIGLTSSDVIDALCLRENGDLLYASSDQVWFSLAPGSPTLVATGASPADLLRSSPAHYAIRAASLGLQANDDLDALVCPLEITFYDLLLPIVTK